jgi:hypothetical protein
MTGNPKECRRNALDCMQLAQMAPSPKDRDHSAELSRTWLRLASELEAGQGLVDILNDLAEQERRAG